MTQSSLKAILTPQVGFAAIAADDPHVTDLRLPVQSSRTPLIVKALLISTD